MRSNAIILEFCKRCGTYHLKLDSKEMEIEIVVCYRCRIELIEWKKRIQERLDSIRGNDEIEE